MYETMKNSRHTNFKIHRTRDSMFSHVVVQKIRKFWKATGATMSEAASHASTMNEAGGLR